MKGLVTIIISVAFLAGCQSIGPKETGGTLIGAVGGGLIGSQIGGGTGQLVGVGLGTLGGAALGNYIGKNMDDNDKGQ
tara:strand:+ start:346 stop:579 length:234 start_codon:yes stop_codon:yes gene_type:complete